MNIIVIILIVLASIIVGAFLYRKFNFKNMTSEQAEQIYNPYTAINLKLDVTDSKKADEEDRQQFSESELVKEVINDKITFDQKKDGYLLINGFFDAIQITVCKKFDKNVISKEYNLSANELETLDINSWYNIISQRVEHDVEGALYKYSKDAPFNEKLSKNIQGHFDTYKQKFS